MDACCKRNQPMFQSYWAVFDYWEGPCDGGRPRGGPGTTKPTPPTKPTGPTQPTGPSGVPPGTPEGCAELVPRSPDGSDWDDDEKMPNCYGGCSGPKAQECCKCCYEIHVILCKSRNPRKFGGCLLKADSLNKECFGKNAWSVSGVCSKRSKGSA